MFRLGILGIQATNFLRLLADVVQALIALPRLLKRLVDEVVQLEHEVQDLRRDLRRPPPGHPALPARRVGLGISSRHRGRRAQRDP